MSKKPALTIFSLTMITIGSVDSVRNLPATALFGSQLIFFFLLGAVFFLIPTALISAELASGWSSEGGIYIWVRQAFGKHIGFLAIWLQWIENVIWYPVILASVAGTIGYLINPNYASNPYFLWFIIVGSFWGVTLLNMKGMRLSAMFSNICALSGLLLPMTLIISLGIIWLILGHPSQIHLDAHSIFPNWQDKSLWISLTAIMMSFCGIEIATVHANDVKNPQHAFPRALIISVIIILVTLILGSLTIAVVLPKENINLVAGVMQAFNAFFAQYHLLWLMPVMALMLILGGLGGVSNWIIAPTKGLMIAAKDGNLPVCFQTTNRHNAPTLILVIQAIVVTLLSGLFIFMPSVNGSYWLLNALATQLYMLMYLLMFVAAVKLRISFPNQPRAFRIPGGLPGLIAVSSVGSTAAVMTLMVSFIPPTGINVGSLANYEKLLVAGLILMCLPPLVCVLLPKKTFDKRPN